MTISKAGVEEANGDYALASDPRAPTLSFVNIEDAGYRIDRFNEIASKAAVQASLAANPAEQGAAVGFAAGEKACIAAEISSPIHGT